MDAAATLSPREAFAPRLAEGRARGIALSLLVHAGLCRRDRVRRELAQPHPEAQEAELWAAVPQAAGTRRRARPDAPLANCCDRRRRWWRRRRPVEVPDAKIAIEKAREPGAQGSSRRPPSRSEASAAEAEREAAEKPPPPAGGRAAEEAGAGRRAAPRSSARPNGRRTCSASRGSGRGQRRRFDDRHRAAVRRSFGELRRTHQGPHPAQHRVRRRGRRRSERRGRGARGTDGTILGRKLVKAAASPAYDNAVLRAIDKTETLPRDIDGRVPPSLLLVFRVRD